MNLNANREHLPRCDRHEVERLWCPDDCPDYGNGFTMTPAEQALVTHHRRSGGVLHIREAETIARRTLPEYRPTAPTTWHVTTPEPAYCHDHDKPPGARLCPTCDDLLDRLLGDVPAIVSDLKIAARKDVTFPRVGTRPQTVDDNGKIIEESPLPVNLAASRCLTDLHHILAPDPIRTSRWWLAHPHDFDRHTMLTRLSRTMSRAHRIIERPEDAVYVGTCPRCALELHTQRGHDVTCPCGYHNLWQIHIHTILADRMDTLMPVSELVIATGLPRDRIKNLTRRMTGIPISRPILDGHIIRQREVTMYRLGDVIAEHERREARRTA